LKNRKLIYILNHFSNNSQGHIFHVINLLEKLSEKGIHIVLIIEKCIDPPKVSDAIKVFAINEKYKLFRIFKLFIILFNLSKGGYKKVFVRISWVATWVSLLVHIFSKIEIYFWFSGQGLYENYHSKKFGKNKFLYFVKSIIPFWVIKTFVYKFVTGPETMGKYMESVMKVNPNKILILYNDIDLTRFNAKNYNIEAIKQELGFQSRDKIILYVKRLSPIKGTNFYFPYILDIFFSVPENNNYNILIVGEGSEKNQLIENISKKSYNNRVHIIGGVPNKEVHKLYSIADIFVNCTLEEGFPRVLIEAMACGIPVVSTDAGGISDVLGSNQKNFMVDKNDRDLFASKLIELSNDEAKRDLLKFENINSVTKYSTENVASMYINKIFNCEN
jgi:glycosyltransferase involved in cell wall biosynthesis